MKLAATHLAQAWAREDLASWENEGGAMRSAPEASRKTAGPARWPAASVMDQSADSEPRGADEGITDTHSLAVLHVSLLLLVPVLAGIAIFWAAAAVSPPQ